MSLPGNRFIYVEISQRANGLSADLNLTPQRYCNFNCVYCDAKPQSEASAEPVDVAALSLELQKLLAQVQNNQLRELPRFRNVPVDLLQLKEVAISGNGEPTLCPNFGLVVDALVRVRAEYPHFFKIVLVSNTAGLLRREVQHGLTQLTTMDEVWLKLDAGTQEYFEATNRPANMSLRDVTGNILLVAQKRPVVIQSLFPMVRGHEPRTEEIDAYVLRLQQLCAAGADIDRVQIYSVQRPAHDPECTHLRLHTLAQISKRVRDQAGLPVEIF